MESYIYKYLLLVLGLSAQLCVDSVQSTFVLHIQNIQHNVI